MATPRRGNQAALIAASIVLAALVGFAGGLLVGSQMPQPEPVPAVVTTPPSPSGEITVREFKVIRVIDGDTFVIEYDGEPTSVRLFGVDAPERGEPGHDEATDALRAMVDGKVVRLEFPGNKKRDNFGRLLCRVSVGDVDVGGVLLEQKLVKSYRDR